MARAAKKSSSSRPSLAKARDAVRAAVRAVGRKPAAGQTKAKKPVPKPAAAPARQAKAAKPKPEPKAAPRGKESAPRSREKVAASAATSVAPAPAARPEPAKPKVKRVPEVSKKEIAELKVELERLKEVYERELSDLEAAFDETQSDLSGEAAFDEEYADAGSFTFERERDLSLGNNIRDLLDRVRHALFKIDDGSYGLCERCGSPIDKARLEALPYASLCITCKQQEEHAR